MIDYSAIKAEIVKGEYLGKSAEEIASALAAQTVSVKRDVSIAEVEGYLRIRGLMAGLEFWAASDEAAADPRKLVVMELVGTIESPRLEIFRTSDPIVYASIEASLSSLIGVGGFTKEHRDDLLAMTTETRPKWPDLISYTDIEAARK